MRCALSKPILETHPALVLAAMSFKVCSCPLYPLPGLSPCSPPIAWFGTAYIPASVRRNTVVCRVHVTEEDNGGDTRPKDQSTSAFEDLRPRARFESCSDRGENEVPAPQIPESIRLGDTGKPSPSGEVAPLALKIPFRVSFSSDSARFSCFSLALNLLEISVHVAHHPSSSRTSVTCSHISHDRTSLHTSPPE